MKDKLWTPGDPLGPQEVENLHRYDDVDKHIRSHHHTLGKRPTQASPGNHNHNDLYVLLAKEKWNRTTITTNASGNATINHLLGVVPTTVLTCSGGPLSGGTILGFVGNDTYTTTTFTVRCYSNVGASLNSTAGLIVCWIAKV